MTEFGVWMQRQFQRRGYSPADFARKSGIDPSVISRWLDGTVTPSIRSADRIADGLGIHRDRVLEALGVLSPVDDIEDDDIRYDVIAAIRRLDRHDPTVRLWLGSLLPTIAALRQAAEEEESQ